MVLKPFFSFTFGCMLCLAASCQQAPALPPLIPHSQLMMKSGKITDYIRERNGGIALTMGRDTLFFSREYLPGLLNQLRYAHPDSLEAVLRGKAAPAFALAFPAPDSQRPLSGWRIALDPGHMAASLEEGKMEGKSVCVQGFPGQAVYEAQLNLATAWVLYDSLTALGAEVMMTRTTGGSVTGLNFAEWKARRWESFLKEEVAAKRMTASNANWYRTSGKDIQIYQRHYNTADLRARAEKIQAFRPHVTFFIHYNIHAPGQRFIDKAGCLPPSDSNYLMAFIPGGFTPGELSDPDDRAALLRLACGPDMEHSQRLTAAFLRHSERLSGVAPATEPANLFYLDRFCVSADSPGMYARNLQLLRKVGGVVCYGEPLCQDYPDEFRQLSQPTGETHGVPVSERQVTVARAYLAAMREFAAGLK